jgi:hypothetical protein
MGTIERSMIVRASPARWLPLNGRIFVVTYIQLPTTNAQPPTTPNDQFPKPSTTNHQPSLRQLLHDVTQLRTISFSIARRTAAGEPGQHEDRLASDCACSGAASSSPADPIWWKLIIRNSSPNPSSCFLEAVPVTASYVCVARADAGAAGGDDHLRRLIGQLPADDGRVTCEGSSLTMA